MTRRQLTYARIVFLVYLVVLLVLCFGQFSSTQDVPKFLWGIPTDKIVHFLMFLPFPILAYLAFDRFQGKRGSSLLWTAAVFGAGVLLAAGTELGQAWLTTYREGDPNDFLSDLLALAVGSVIVLIVILVKPKK